jgi:phosphatidate cytidylyltransferase
VPLSSLQRRTLTALLLAPPAVAAVLLLSTRSFAVVIGLVLLIGAWEWSRLAGIATLPARLTFTTAFALSLYLLEGLPRQWVLPTLMLLALWWSGVALHLSRIGAVEASTRVAPLFLLSGLPVLLGPWLALLHLHALAPRGPELVLFLLLLIWTADIAAFFSGRRWGVRKLAPVLSPGKTRAGAYGALAGAAGAALALAWWLELPAGLAIAAVAICVLTACFSIVGDLFESLLKRRRGTKDSGRLLPGHGGVLDRVDSLTAAAPIFTLGMVWLEAQL